MGFNRNGLGKLSIVLIILLIIALLIGIYFWAFSKEDATSSTFPNNIGDYSLNEKTALGREPYSGCNNIQQGEICATDIKLDYVNKDRSKIVFVVLRDITKGKNITMLAMANSLSKIDSSSIYRAENHELVWFTNSDNYDVIFVQQGSIIITSQGIETYDYPSQAEVSNEVTQYFIKKYPPAK